MVETIYQQRQTQRRLGKMKPRDMRRFAELTQMAGPNPNNTPESVAAEMEKRLLVGNKNLSDLDWRGVDMTKIKANTDGINARGVTTDSKTKIGRAVGINLDGADINGSQILGDINGGSAIKARIRGVKAKGINRNGFDDSGSIQASNDYSFTSSIGAISTNVNAYNNSYVSSNRDKSVVYGGWQTSCLFDDASQKSSKMINVGLANAGLDRIDGTEMEFRPRATEEEFSIHGARFVRAKLNMTAAAAIERDNGTMIDCKIVHDDAPEAEATPEKPFNKFAALDGFRKEALDMAAPAAKPVRSYRHASRPAAALAMFGMFG